MRMIFLVVLLLQSSAIAAPDDFKSVKSLFLDPLAKTMKKLSSETVPAGSPPITLDCFGLEGNDLYMGVKQVMDIDANMSVVDSILNDFPHYGDLFPGLKKAEILMRDGNKLKTAWETIVPLPFVPNVKYEMIYVLESPTPDQRIFHYHLREAGSMKFSDGFILLKKINEKLTRYIEYDFYDAEWGPAKVMGNHRLWYDSIEGLAHSDLAIKFKAENPSWDHKRAKKEAGWSLKSDHIDVLVNACIKNKITLKPSSLQGSLPR